LHRGSSDGLLPLVTAAFNDLMQATSPLAPFSASEEQAGRLSVFTHLVSGDVSKRAERFGCTNRGLLPLLLASGWYTPNESDAGGTDACSCGLASGRRAK